jgi:hypothetical protein
MAIATVMAVLFLILLLLGSLGYLANPYVGLLLFVAIPAAFVVGLLLIPLGMWLDARRLRRHPGAPAADWPVIDLRQPHHRRLAAVVLALTLVNIVIVSLAAFGTVHYMETNSFCGRVCHTSMEPEFVAHAITAHARVNCVDCHIAAGARGLVESKAAGSRRLWHVMTGNVPTPIPWPIHGIPDPGDTCLNCHRRDHPHGDVLKVIREFADDEENSETTTTLTLHVGSGAPGGGSSGGSHWHAREDVSVEYVATDATLTTIPYVRVRAADGTVREFTTEGTTPEAMAAGQRRKMSCLDCHNRPAHTFEPTAERAVDNAIAAGRIPQSLPFARREAVAAVTAEYPNREAAFAGIERALREHYRAIPSADGRLVDQAIAGARQVWAANVFPAMKVTWGTYPNQLNHNEWPGCFRCHDDEHKASDGSVIRQDCEICHTGE